MLEKIIDVVQEELDKLSHTVVDKSELDRAQKKAEVDHLAMLESNQKQAMEIGQFYLARKDEEYLYTYTEVQKDHLGYQIKDFVNAYFRASLMHKGTVLPLQEKDREYWHELQLLSDQEDERILSQRTRSEHVESPSCSLTITSQKPKPFSYAHATPFFLENGLKVLASTYEALPKIDLIIDFKAKSKYDPDGKEGLSSFVAKLLLEGTKKYSACELIELFDSYGMAIHTAAGFISVSLLAEDLPICLELLEEIVTNASFEESAFEKVRKQMLADLDEYWDSPTQFIVQIARDEIYKSHPSSKNSLGTVEGVKSITREDIRNFYTKYYSPRNARLALVGALGNYDIRHLLAEKLARWQGADVPKLTYPPLEPVHKRQVTYPILRDQTVLCYAGLSIARIDPDYDELLLFDQVFTGGVLHSMASRLFDLRERSGLFYTIGGSLLYHSDKQKGLTLIKTIVSNDRLQEAEHAIEQVINTAIDTLSIDELEEARNAIINSLVDNFASHYQTALALLFKDYYQLPENYFDKRNDALQKLSISNVQQAVKKYLNTKNMIVIKVGRV